MSDKNLTRRNFLGWTTAGVAGTVVSTGISSFDISSYKKDVFGVNEGKYSTEAFAREVETLPMEEPYDYHKRLSTAPVHIFRRDKGARPKEGEMLLPDKGWKLIWNPGSSIILQNAVRDFQDYLDQSQDVKVEVVERNSLSEWRNLNQSIVVGTRDQLPGCGFALKTPKDYEIVATSERIIVCGYDEAGSNVRSL